MNLSLLRLCRSAGVNYSNVWRWKGEYVSPRLDTYEQTMAALDGELDRIAAEMRDRLETPSQAGAAE